MAAAKATTAINIMISMEIPFYVKMYCYLMGTKY